jgi:hypothetical protein
MRAGNRFDTLARWHHVAKAPTRTRPFPVLAEEIRFYLGVFSAWCAHLLTELCGYTDRGWNSAVIQLQDTL